MAAKKKESKKLDVNQVAKSVLDKALERAEKRGLRPKETGQRHRREC
jgi:hypothetical protein